MALITLTTDFGSIDPFVGIMKGVLATRAPGVPVVDLTHGIPPQQVVPGALALQAAVPYFPLGTVHLAVVDPGVGSNRRALCVETARGTLVGPDNGLLSLAAAREGIRRIVHLTDERYFLSPRSRTFHGRDVFAPVAAALATGTPAALLGPEATTMEEIALPSAEVDATGAQGQVVYVDGFGNLTTNLPPAALEQSVGTALVRVGSATIVGLSATYAAVPTGEPVAVVNSWNMVEIAVRDGSAAAVLGAGVGTPVRIEMRR